METKFKKETKIKTCVGGGGGGSSLFSMSDLTDHTATVGTVFLASIDSTPSSPPATEGIFRDIHRTYKFFGIYTLFIVDNLLAS